MSAFKWLRSSERDHGALGRSLMTLPRPFEDDDRARRREGPAMTQFGNSGDKIEQTVAVARHTFEGFLQRGGGAARAQPGGGLAPDPVCLGSSETMEGSI